MPDNSIRSRYCPFNDEIADQLGGIETLLRLQNMLYDRKHRFIEQPISRQQRRSEGRPPQYREYIVIDRDDARYETGLRSGAILKRLKTLHAVRGHFRHYRSGLVVPVKPHMRGKGDLTQVKEYLPRR
jgi:hypothetical protein